MKKVSAALAAVISIFFLLFYASNIPAAPDAFVDDYGTDYGAVLVLNFEEGTGTTTFDQSPYGNDGYGYAPGAWLEGYDQRVKLTTNSTDVDEVLTDFPVLIFLSNSTAGENDEDVSFIFDEIGANWRKIGVTTSDGFTQCYVEKVKWDDTNEQAWLFFKAPSISNTSDTDFYFYYDNDVADNVAYVGDPDDAVTHNVWDNNFKFVSHMRDDPDTSHVRDSTQYANDGTKRIANRPLVTTSGRIDDAQDFTDNIDYISTFLASELTGDFTFEAWVNSETLTGYFGYNGILSGFESTPVHSGFMISTGTGNNIELVAADVGAESRGGTGWVPETGVWYHVVGVHEGDNNILYVDSTNEAEFEQSVTMPSEAIRIGIFYTDYHDGGVDGIIDEPRISDIARTPAWIETSYESERDHLVDFGSEDTDVPRIIYWTVGKYGEAVNFTKLDSAGVYIQIGNVSTSLRTIWFWTNLSSTSEPILQLKTGVYINVTDGVLSATGFAGTPTFYVDGEETTTITSGEWHHVAVVSDANEDASNFIIGCANSDYLTGKIDQLRAFTVPKTAAEVGVQYLDPTGGMYSGSVIVSDDFRILNSTLDEELQLDEQGLDLNHNYILYSDFNHWLDFTMAAGQTDVTVNMIPAGVLTNDRHYHRITFAVDVAPGVGKECNVTLTNGASTISVSLTGVQTSGWSDVGAFDLDVSAEALTLMYTQDAGGSSTNGFMTIKYHYKETPP